MWIALIHKIIWCQIILFLNIDSFHKGMGYIFLDIFGIHQYCVLIFFIKGHPLLELYPDTKCFILLLKIMLFSPIVMPSEPQGKLLCLG